MVKGKKIVKLIKFFRIFSFIVSANLGRLFIRSMAKSVVRCCDCRSHSFRLELRVADQISIALWLRNSLTR